MSPSRALWWLVLLCGAAGCGETGPATVRIFGLDPATGRYGSFNARLDTLQDAAQMRGGTVRFIGGTTVKGDFLESVKDPKSENILQANGGGAVKCSFTERDGVLHADDYDSLNMASSYWALERSRALFVDLGVDPGALEPIATYYHPRIELLTKLVPTYFLLADNAAYAPTFDGFMILPHVVLDAVPFSTNLGVMAHEYSHKVYNRLVERGQRVPSWLRNDWTERATNQLRGLDEGVADMFGHLITGDPDFIQPSEGAGVNLDRDMSRVREDNALLVDEWLALPDAKGEVREFRQHLLGAHVAGALWQFGEEIGDHRGVAVALLQAQRLMAEEMAQEPRYDFSVLGFFDKVAAQFDGPERQSLCAVLKARFPVLIKVDVQHALVNCP
jgi:hypothetical protein